MVNNLFPDTRDAHPDPAIIITREGETIKLMCRFPKPIMLCNFNLPNVFEILEMNQMWLRKDNFRYFGRGLHYGECGIKILKVEKKMHGVASCTLDINDGDLDAFANITIFVLEKPEPPVISSFDLNNQELENFQAVCDCDNGRPAANISWTIGGEPLSNKYNFITPNETLNSTFYSTKSVINFELEPKHNNKTLVCTAQHILFPKETLNSSYKIEVLFKPYTESRTSFSNLKLGETFQFGPIYIVANPRANISWKIDDTEMKENHLTSKYEVFSFNTPDDETRVATYFRLNVFQNRDTKRSIFIHASNQIGKLKQVVTLEAEVKDTCEFDLETSSKIFIHFLSLQHIPTSLNT